MKAKYIPPLARQVTAPRNPQVPVKKDVGSRRYPIEVAHHEDAAALASEVQDYVTFRIKGEVSVWRADRKGNLAFLYAPLSEVA